jgi:hypothetical protein
MMIRPSDDRGQARLHWLDSRHSFSFGDYFDPQHMGFGALRVINEDRVVPGGGFPTHGHRDMEIITYVLDGALEHKDSLGTGTVIRPGEVQRMTAGTGIRHSEFNASADQPVHFLQVWIIPQQKGLAPAYEQKAFPEAERSGRLRLVGSRDGREGSITIHADADLYASLLKAGDAIAFQVRPHRQAWIQLARGSVAVNGQELAAGDGAGVCDSEQLAIKATTDAEFLLFDLANESVA